MIQAKLKQALCTTAYYRCKINGKFKYLQELHQLIQSLHIVI